MSSGNSHFEVEVSPFEKKDIFIPSSKSYANRLLILAALYPGAITLKNLPGSTDVLTMLECLKILGLKISGTLEELVIENSFPECEEKTSHIVDLHTGDGGTTNRFLLGLVSLGENTYEFFPSERMSHRPVDNFVSELSDLGVLIKPGKRGWLEVTGPLGSVQQEIEIDCSQSTQFATSVQMILATKGINVIPANMASSSKYFDITKNLCRDFNNGKKTFIVPLDFSSFSYPVALAACIGKLTLTEFTGVDPFQADSELVDLLLLMGADLKVRHDSFTVSKSHLKAIDIDCSDFPDLVPTLAYLCSYAEGSSHLKNISVLRHKESDRIEEVLKILHAFQIIATYDEEQDVMTIYGRRPIDEYIELETAKDHRMIMVAYLFMRTNGGGMLYHTEHIKKSYPHFLEAFG